MVDVRSDLLRRARVEHQVCAAESVGEVVLLLEGFGAQHVDFDRYRDELVDEFVEPERVRAVLTLTDPELLRARASSEERELFVPDPDEAFDPLEYGVEMAQWTAWAHEVEVLERLIVLIEGEPSAPDRVTNFRVCGAGQWLREALWAATGVVPRDPGAPTARSGLFGEAFILDGRGEFQAEPVQR